MRGRSRTKRRDQSVANLWERRRMTEDFVGFCWHVHHDILVEWCSSFKERLDYIETSKPPSEVPLRRKLFQPVRGKLPDAIIAARRAYDQATLAFYQVKETADRVLYNRAWQAVEKARDEYNNCYTANLSLIKKLHEQECPNCPWDGWTIFPVR